MTTPATYQAFYEKTGDVIFEKATLGQIMQAMPAGSRFVSGNTFDPFGKIKEIRATYAVPGKGNLIIKLNEEVMK